MVGFHTSRTPGTAFATFAANPGCECLLGFATDEVGGSVWGPTLIITMQSTSFIFRTRGPISVLSFCHLSPAHDETDKSVCIYHNNFGPIALRHRGVSSINSRLLNNCRHAVMCIQFVLAQTSIYVDLNVYIFLYLVGEVSPFILLRLLIHFCCPGFNVCFSSLTMLFVLGFAVSDSRIVVYLCDHGSEKWAVVRENNNNTNDKKKK